MKKTITLYLILNSAFIIHNSLFADYWTQKADFPGGPREMMTGFSIGTKGYLGTGYDGTTDFNDFWEYDPASNSWMPKASLPGMARRFAVSFSIGNKGYIGTGYN